MTSQRLELGPLEYLIIRCDQDRFLVGVLPELRALERHGMMRIGALFFVHKDAMGAPSIEMSQQGDRAEDRSDALVYDVQRLLEAGDFDEIVAALPPDATAALVILEHTWAVRLWQRIADTRGEVIGCGMMPAVDVAEMVATRDDGRYSAQ